MPPFPGHSDLPAQALQLLRANRFGEAEKLCRQALKRDKNDVNAYHVLGLSLAERGEFDQAASIYKKGLAVRETTNLLCSLGRLRRTRGLYDEAITWYERALRRDPSSVIALAGKADSLELKGAFAEARATLEPVIACGTDNGEALLVYATVLQREGAHQEAVEFLRDALARHRLPDRSRRGLLYSLGQALNELRAYDEAFDAFAQANRVLRRPFSIERLRRGFDRIMTTFSAENLARLPRARCDSEIPVFIISMPRSGSTLLEQVLDAHPQCHGAGEIDALLHRAQEVARESKPSAPFPDGVLALGQPALDRLSGRYLGCVKKLDRRAARITDKHLSNFRLLGLVALLFPRARIIECRRDPMDVGLSCFMHPLQPNVLPWSTDLRHIGLFHREYDRLIAHWMEVLELPILSVQYEELVADQQAVSRQIVEFCDLPWDDACLRFHETGRDVATASYHQVRKPLYKTALKRYERYAAHLDPLREALS